MARAITPAHFPWFDASRYTFSLGIESGGGVWLSGHTGSAYEPGTRRITVAGGLAAQVRTAYAKGEAILQAAGRTLADVVHVTEYVTPAGLERYRDVDAVRRELFGARPPTLNTVPVRALTRPEALIEVELTAGAAGSRATDGGQPGAAAGEAGGLIYLPTLLATAPDGTIEAPGDVVGQTDAILEKAARILAALGSDLAHVAMTVDYLVAGVRGDYRRSGEVRQARLGPVFPGAAGLLMPRLIHPEAVVQYDIVAARETPVRVDPGWPRYRDLTYSPGIRAGRHLFLSGQGALDPVTGAIQHPGDVAAQAAYIYGNVAKVVEAAGGSRTDLVRTVEYVTPDALPRYREVGAARRDAFAPPYPASTGLVCEALLRPGMAIEVVPFAILDGAP